MATPFFCTVLGMVGTWGITHARQALWYWAEFQASQKFFNVFFLSFTYFTFSFLSFLQFLINSSFLLSDSNRSSSHNVPESMTADPSLLHTNLPTPPPTHMHTHSNKAANVTEPKAGTAGACWLYNGKVLTVQDRTPSNFRPTPQMRRACSVHIP